MYKNIRIFKKNEKKNVCNKFYQDQRIEYRKQYKFFITVFIRFFFFFSKKALLHYNFDSTITV